MAIKWGILGASGIGAQFAAHLPAAPGAVLHAVASQNADRARAFAANTGAAAHYATYENLVADPEIDIVYVATPAEHHATHAVMALEAGKPVLCEKPFALNADDAARVAALAASRNLFCMEAMWMRFHPLVQQLKTRIDGGELGPLRLFRAEAGYRTPPEKLAGGDPGRGALLNFGVYGVSLAHYLFGAPQSAHGRLRPFNDTVDAGFSATLHYDNFDAIIAGSVDATLGNEAMIAGEDGRLTLAAPFFDPPALLHERTPAPSNISRTSVADAPAAKIGAAMRLASKIPFARAVKASTIAALLRGKTRLTPAPAGVSGLTLQAVEAMNCLQSGASESAIMPLSETIAVLETLDAVKRG